MMKDQKKVSRRGAPRYDQNPFIQQALKTRNKVKRVSTGSGEKMMVINDKTGEVIAQGCGFWFTEEVDSTRFVKLFINGVKAFKDLTSPGTKVFEILYLQVQSLVGKDELWLNFHSVNQDETPISEATFYRGMKELIAKGFIAESTTPNKYFLNPDYIWNGDRLAFVKEYRVKPERPDPVRVAMEQLSDDDTKWDG